MIVGLGMLHLRKTFFSGAICRRGIILLLLGGMLLSGCSPSGDFQWGVYTKQVKGRIVTEENLGTAKPFLLVMNYHRTLIETSSGYLSRVTAFVAYPDGDGDFSVPFDADTVSLDIAVYAKGSVVKRERFRRSLAIGSYTYNVKLIRDENWRNNYYLKIKPFLVEFITEQRYLMNRIDKLYIGEWLAEMDTSI